MGFDAQSSDAEYSRVSQLYVDLWGGFFTIPIDLPGSKYRKAIQARNELREVRKKERTWAKHLLYSSRWTTKIDYDSRFWIY